jgi:hypothetical protein
MSVEASPYSVLHLGNLFCAFCSPGSIEQEGVLAMTIRKWAAFFGIGVAAAGLLAGIVAIS